MPISLRRNLCLSSILLLCVSCSVTRGYKLTGENVIRPNPMEEAVATFDHGLKYKMSVQLFRNYFTGILLYKKTDSTTYHLAFVTELGLKMFEMQIKSGTLKTLYCFEPMNKPKVKALLEKQMNILFLTDFNKPITEYTHRGGAKIFLSKNGKEKNYYWEAYDLFRGVKIKKGPLTKVNSSYAYQEWDHKVPYYIWLSHKGFLRLKIQLTRITNG